MKRDKGISKQIAKGILHGQLYQALSIRFEVWPRGSQRYIVLVCTTECQVHSVNCTIDPVSYFPCKSGMSGHMGGWVVLDTIGIQEFYDISVSRELLEPWVFN